MTRRILPLLFSALLLSGPLWADDKAKSDIDKLQGTWMPGASETERGVDGRATDNEVEIKGDKWVLTSKSRGLSGEMSMKIDPTKTPKEIDWVEKDGTLFRVGIYELDGDKLTICEAPPARGRPGDFTLPPGSRRRKSTYTRKSP